MYIPLVERRPHLFLSHSSDNSDFALKLADDLNVLEVDIWIDKWEIEGGDSLFDKINEGIKQSKYIALLFSKSFITKKWSSSEVRAGFSKEMAAGEKTIIPLILEPVELPFLLQDKLYISFEDDYYVSLTRLAGIIHGISTSEISKAVRRMPPKSLEDAVDMLVYLGKDPYMLIPEDVFAELAKTDHALVEGNRLSFPSGDFLALDGISARTKDYLKRVQIGVDRINRDESRMLL
jgi:hypothetical protein